MYSNNLTISKKKQIWNNIKINVSYRTNQQMLHYYPVNMGVGILNFSIYSQDNLLHCFCLFFCYVFISTFFILFSQDFRVGVSSLLRVGCKALWYYEFDMYSTIKTNTPSPSWRYVTTSRVHEFCTHGSLTNQKPTFLSSRG